MILFFNRVVPFYFAGTGPFLLDRKQKMNSKKIIEYFDKGFSHLIGDLEGLFTHCHRAAAEHLAERLGDVRILEICCGVGAITTALSRNALSVIAVDSNSLRLKCAEINVETYGNPNRARFQCSEALSIKLWIDVKPDVVVADPYWADPENRESEISVTEPPVQEVLNMAKTVGVPGLVLRLSPFFEMELLTRWEPFELEKVFIDGTEKYSFVYFGTLCKRPGSLTNLQFLNHSS